MYKLKYTFYTKYAFIIMRCIKILRLLGNPQKRSFFNGRAIKGRRGGKDQAIKENYNFKKKSYGH